MAQPRIPTRSQHRDPLLVSIPETCRLLSLGRTSVYELIEAGDLRVIRVGRRVLVPTAELDRVIEQRMPGVGAVDNGGAA